MRKLAQGPWGVRRERTKSLVFHTSPLWRYQLSSRPICNADMTKLSCMTNRHAGLDLSVHAARLLISVVNVDSVKIQAEQHIWLLQLERGSSPVQAAPASGAAAFPASPVPELPAKSASDDSLATGVIHPAVAIPPMPAKVESQARDVLLVNASHATMARLSPMARDSRIAPLTCNSPDPFTGCDSSLGSKACMTSHTRNTASSSHSSMESETHHAR